MNVNDCSVSRVVERVKGLDGGKGTVSSKIDINSMIQADFRWIRTKREIYCHLWEPQDWIMLPVVREGLHVSTCSECNLHK